MDFRDVNRTIYVSCYNFREIADMKRLAQYDEYATREIEKLKKTIEDIKEYRTELYKYVQELQNTTYEPVLTLKRHKEYHGKVFYNIFLKHVYDAERYTTILHERYTGSERHKAIARFEELKKQHNGIKAIKDIEKGRWE